MTGKLGHYAEAMLWVIMNICNYFRLKCVSSPASHSKFDNYHCTHDIEATYIDLMTKLVNMFQADTHWLKKSISNILVRQSFMRNRMLFIRWYDDYK